MNNNVILDTHQTAHLPAVQKERENMHPIIVMLIILLLTTLMTYFIPSGSYQKSGKSVVPGTYQTIEKTAGVTQLFAIPQKQDKSAKKEAGKETIKSESKAHAVSLISMFQAIPKGMDKTAGLIFMVLMIGGMFGILSHAGAIDAGLERLLSLTKGNFNFLIITLMIAFSAGSTFLGLVSEYLLIIPLMVALANRVGLPNIIGFAALAIAQKVGYLTSVTNPLPLTIAQPLLDLPIYSGAGMRFFFYVIFLTVGIAFMLLMIRRYGYDKSMVIEFKAHKLSRRHTAMLSALMLGVAFIVFASAKWQWKKEELSAYYIGLSMVLAVLGGLGASAAAKAFVSGMRQILMAAILIGVASAVSIVLIEGQILHTIIHGLVSMIGENNRLVAATGMFFSQLLLDFLIPSTSGQAAVAMPILGPIGQLTGVSPQVTVLSFLFGNGLTNIFTPTSSTLLAFLATANVPWSQWAKFIFPLWCVFSVLAIVLLIFAVLVGY